MATTIDTEHDGKGQRHVSELRFCEPAPIVDSLTRRLRARGAD